MSISTVLLQVVDGTLTLVHAAAHQEQEQEVVGVVGVVEVGIRKGLDSQALLTMARRT